MPKKSRTPDRIDELFAKERSWRGRAFKDLHSPAALAGYEADLRAIVERGKTEPLPSVRTIIDYMDRTHGVKPAIGTLSKHINAIQNNKPLW